MEETKEERFRYPVLSVRVEQELLDWTKTESKKYKSWNLFFRELRKRYENNKV